MKLRILHLFVIYFIILTVQVLKTSSVPEELFGTWKTTSPGYETASLILTTDSIIFMNGEYVDINRISKIEKHDVDGMTVFVVFYTSTNGLKYEIPICHYSSEKDGSSIWFKNQEHIVWLQISL